MTIKYDTWLNATPEEIKTLIWVADTVRIQTAYGQVETTRAAVGNLLNKYTGAVKCYMTRGALYNTLIIE